MIPETVLTWIKLISATVAFVYGVMATFTELWATDTEGARSLTKAGKVGFSLACMAFLLSTVSDYLKDRSSARTQATADSTFQAKTSEITIQQRVALAEIAAVGSQNQQLRERQEQALLQTDSVLAASRALARLQQGAAASLETNLRVSQHIADSLRQVNANINERTRETMALVHRSSNPLSSMSAPFTLFFTRSDSLSGQILDALYTRVMGTDQQLATATSLSINGEETHVFLPDHVTLYFWHAPTCDSASFNYNTVKLSAVRDLNLRDAKVVFNRDYVHHSTESLVLRWEDGPFELRTRDNLAVDDLRDACVYVDPGLSNYMGYGIAHEWWYGAYISIAAVTFPQGRIANFKRQEAQGFATRYKQLLSER
jgi:hypothetical protein